MAHTKVSNTFRWQAGCACCGKVKPAKPCLIHEDVFYFVGCFECCQDQNPDPPAYDAYTFDSGIGNWTEAYWPGWDALNQTITLSRGEFSPCAWGFSLEDYPTCPRLIGLPDCPAVGDVAYSLELLTSCEFRFILRFFATLGPGCDGKCEDPGGNEEPYEFYFEYYSDSVFGQNCLETTTSITLDAKIRKNGQFYINGMLPTTITLNAVI